MGGFLYMVQARRDTTSNRTPSLSPGRNFRGGRMMMLIWSGSGMRCECFMAKYFNASKEQTSIILVDGIRKVQGLDQTSHAMSQQF